MFNAKEIMTLPQIQMTIPMKEAHPDGWGSSDSGGDVKKEGKFISENGEKDGTSRLGNMEMTEKLKTWSVGMGKLSTCVLDEDPNSEMSGTAEKEV